MVKILEHFPFEVKYWIKQDINKQDAKKNLWLLFIIKNNASIKTNISLKLIFITKLKFNFYKREK